MKFGIASLPRCGSTAVYRVLQTAKPEAIAYEPSFFDVGTNRRKIKSRIAKTLRHAAGFKHVWDPNGWPFRNPQHVSSLAAMEKCGELIDANRAVLECCQKVVLLRRRSMFDRTLSDLWGQETNLWGHDPNQPHDAAEAANYQATASARNAQPIDVQVFGWYMENAKAWEDAIVSDFGASDVKTFYYEDLFSDANVSSGTPSGWRELAEWIDLAPDFNSIEVRSILSPRSKLNSAATYRPISNLDELKSRFPA